MNETAEKSNSFARMIKPLKIAIALLVLAFLSWTIYKCWVEIRANQYHLENVQINWFWLVCGLALSVLGLFPGSVAWMQTLRSFKQKFPIIPALDAYFMGHLGKYVPGKAMVLVLRVGRLQPLGVQVRPAIVSVFVETLTSISTGGILGAILVLFSDVPNMYRWSALLIVVPGLALIAPISFRTVLVFLAKSKIGKVPQNVHNAFNWIFMLRNCLWMSIAWLIQGTSGWLVLLALSPSETLRSPLGWCMTVAAVCLGAVAGFASMLPSGAVIRELVITWLLASLVGEPIALVSAIVMRLTSIAAELTVIGTFHAWMRVEKNRQKESSQST